MPTAVETLLTAEEAVQDLVTTLGRLKAEVENYAEAGRALDGVRGDLHGFVARTTDLAEATHATIATLGRIGTPELLSQLDAVRARCEASQASVDQALAACRQIGVAQRAQGDRLDALAEKVDRTLARIEGAVVDRLVGAIREADRPLATLMRRQTFAIVLIMLTLLAGMAALGLSLPSIRAAVGLH